MNLDHVRMNTPFEDEECTLALARQDNPYEIEKTFRDEQELLQYMVHNALFFTDFNDYSVNYKTSDKIMRNAIIQDNDCIVYTVKPTGSGSYSMKLKLRYPRVFQTRIRYCNSEYLYYFY